MTETMGAVTPMPNTTSAPVQSQSFETGGGDIFEQQQTVVADIVEQPTGVVEESPVDADKILDYTKEHGIEEGFEFLAGETVQVDQLVIEEKKQPESVEQEVHKKEDTIPKEKLENPEEITLKEEVEKLKGRLVELTEGHEGIKKELADVTKQVADTMEITRATVGVLYELVKKLHEEEQDKKRKQSLWMMLAKLAGFLATSLLSNPQDGEKVLKGEPVK